MTISRDELMALAREALSGALDERGKAAPDDLGPETPIFGRGALLDSLGLATLVMELEARIEEAHDVTVVIADDRAMSRRNSPFRTLASLVDYVEERLREAERG